MLSEQLVQNCIADKHLAGNFVTPVTRFCYLKYKGNLLDRKSALFHETYFFSICE